MRHNYAGDQGDYAKYALINALASDGRQVVGVNWYLTVHDEVNGDGDVRPHLDEPDEWEHLDSRLLASMVEAFCGLPGSQRRVELLEQDGMLPMSTVFFTEPLPTGALPPAERIAAREEWHRQAMRHMAAADLVFLDPDNGFEVPSRGPRSKWRCKYATYAEVNDYLAAGKSVVPYQHARRMAWPALVTKVTAEMREAGVEMADPGFVAFGDRGFFLLSRDPAQVAAMTQTARDMQERLCRAGWEKLRVTVISPPS